MKVTVGQVQQLKQLNVMGMAHAQLSRKNLQLHHEAARAQPDSFARSVKVHAWAGALCVRQAASPLTACIDTVCSNSRMRLYPELHPCDSVVPLTLLAGGVFVTALAGIPGGIVGAIVSLPGVFFMEDPAIAPVIGLFIGGAASAVIVGAPLLICGVIAIAAAALVGATVKAALTALGAAAGALVGLGVGLYDMLPCVPRSPVSAPVAAESVDSMLRQTPVRSAWDDLDLEWQDEFWEVLQRLGWTTATL